MIKDGWHNLTFGLVYVFEGCVIYGCTRTRTTYPYRWHKDLDCWVIENKPTVKAMYAGFRRGTMKMW